MRLADIFGYDTEKARIAGLLHDIGGIHPNGDRIDISEAVGIEILREEEELPLILHQKISILNDLGGRHDEYRKSNVH